MPTVLVAARKAPDAIAACGQACGGGGAVERRSTFVGAPPEFLYLLDALFHDCSNVVPTCYLAGRTAGVSAKQVNMDGSVNAAAEVCEGLNTGRGRGGCS